ncbi:Glycosyl transferase family 2 [Flavobacterium glycines]|uniref:Glycosyl transferase n=1 Tax=Flavobacterium glycines TaxID=551990 RepID=A0A1B9DG82_9FLAO|nr:glycosyltransferase [Flavobacterium glycines]OCB68722.1 hypothetical protein FBGL_16165 [Flavobacterium glycines]GEL11409.1 glycosyl transferase [Flavobacterium glycines]SDJ66030.1 Glycosyl transferase family 2 [Flavobacterium glycines]
MKLKEIPLSLFSELYLKSLNSNKLKNVKSNHSDIIVSFTTIPSRLKKVHITVRSILNQKLQPKKIILWLNESDKKYVPESLLKLEGSIFNIKYVTLNCPHIKLVYALEQFPEECIVTCDDDFIYDRNWLKRLSEEHLKHPNNIIALKVRQIQFDNNKKLLPYKSWNLSDIKKNKTVLAIGSEGVLYPPKAFLPIAIDSELFLKLTPKADDLWFKAMAILNNTEITLAQNPPKEPIPVFGTQEISLKKANVGQNQNVKQMENLIEHFKLNLHE